MERNERKRLLKEDLITTRIQPIGASAGSLDASVAHVIAAQTKGISSS